MYSSSATPLVVWRWIGELQQGCTSDLSPRMCQLRKVVTARFCSWRLTVYRLSDFLWSFFQSRKGWFSVLCILPQRQTEGDCTERQVNFHASFYIRRGRWRHQGMVIWGGAKALMERVYQFVIVGIDSCRASSYSRFKEICLEIVEISQGALLKEVERDSLYPCRLRRSSNAVDWPTTFGAGFDWDFLADMKPILSLLRILPNHSYTLGAFFNSAFPGMSSFICSKIPFSSSKGRCLSFMPSMLTATTGRSETGPQKGCKASKIHSLSMSTLASLLPWWNSMRPIFLHMADLICLPVRILWQTTGSLNDNDTQGGCFCNTEFQLLGSLDDLFKSRSTLSNYKTRRKSGWNSSSSLQAKNIIDLLVSAESIIYPTI